MCWKLCEWNLCFRYIDCCWITVLRNTLWVHNICGFTFHVALFQRKGVYNILVVKVIVNSRNVVVNVRILTLLTTLLKFTDTANTGSKSPLKASEVHFHVSRSLNHSVNRFSLLWILTDVIIEVPYGFGGNFWDTV
jgi:hypothetical protein